MNFEEMDELMKELLELHKNFNYLSDTAQLIVKDYLYKKYCLLEEILCDTKNNLVSEMKILENNLTKE